MDLLVLTRSSSHFVVNKRRIDLWRAFNIKNSFHSLVQLLTHEALDLEEDGDLSSSGNPESSGFHTEKP